MALPGTTPAVVFKAYVVHACLPRTAVEEDSGLRPEHQCDGHACDVRR